MKLILFSFVLLFHVIKANAGIYPSIIWDYKNPIFSSGEGFYTEVKSYSMFYFVCSNIGMVLTYQTVQPEKNYENFFLVDKHGYDHCRVNTSQAENRLLLKCDRPMGLKFKYIYFSPYSALPNINPVFKKGNTYYFISTADGTEHSLDNTKDGHCLTHKMRMAVYVCKDNEAKCGDESDESAETTATPTIPPVTCPTDTCPTDTWPTATWPTATWPTATWPTATWPTATWPTATYYPATDSVNLPSECIPGGYNDSQALSLVWEIPYNKTQTEHISENSGFPVIVLCKEPNSTIHQLDSEGKPVNDWLCEKACQHLIILKPKYLDDEHYIFEAKSANGSLQLWKSTLVINVDKFKKFKKLISESYRYHEPRLTFLISMSFLAGFLNANVYQ
ncbi:hypothetical protein GZ77_13700 [Endozoicomonas montiporae]|uniref:Ephrin RBD domain-containing protein n=1 Tax=Endozoicomonas montiporae TaxID=1027273 RepID=A0A081N4Q7_9GAMM|nr:hypothetical protein [Endozoicomonas montiporae]KEQ13430.1 hypothetical protein GZ77_13700 [Endozoicomonas montiporae]